MFKGKPNFPKLLNNLTLNPKKNIPKSEKFTSKDTSTINSLPETSSNILNSLKSNTQNAITHPTQGSKTVLTLNKNNNINNINRGKRMVTFEETSLRKFGELPKIKSSDTDGIIGEKGTDKMTQKKENLGLKVNRFQTTGRINRSLTNFIGRKIPYGEHKYYPKNIFKSEDNTKIFPEVRIPK